MPFNVKMWPLCAALALTSPLAAQTTDGGDAPLVGQATMVDGDTLQLNGQRVRIYGIDAFEADQQCPTVSGGTRRCGADASHRMTELLAEGPVICIRRDTDAYGRIVAVCRVGPTDIGAVMVREGLAVAFTRYATDYIADEEYARTSRAGAWNAEFQRPEDYRAGGAGNIATAQRTVSVGGCDIRGNINREGQRIYHLPTDPYWARTRPEATFCSEDEARAAGFRRAGQPGAVRPSAVMAPARAVSAGAAGSRPFANCAAARAAGAAPVRRGQPGYGPHLDRDNDGVGCER